MRKNIAKITDTFLGRESHGILTCYLTVDYGGSGQMIGGYGLDEPTWGTDDGFVVGDRPDDPTAKFAGRRGRAYGMEFVHRIIKACGVDSWEQIKGRTIYVLDDLPEDGSTVGSGKVIGIENLPTEPGERFIFDDLHIEFVTEENP